MAKTEDTILQGLPDYFEPIRKLGEGGMGVVWSVRDRRVDKVGALKVIRRREETTDLSIKRFEREIRNFAQLVHPYIVQVYDVGKMLTGEPYIFMEQVNGSPINAEMLRDKPFNEVVQLIDRILEGLDEAHANDLIHRDLKPDNILVTVDSEGRLMPKLMDFGLALRVDETELRITNDGMVVGTPIYMAPEQACDEHYQICPATDFYGIGCILYELFSGKPPFTGSNAVMVMVAQARETPKPFMPSEEFKEAERLAPIIMKLLEKMPDSRYETAADLRAAIRQVFPIHDGLHFGTSALRPHDSDTVFDVRKDEETPFFSSEIAPKAYASIMPELEHCNYNYSVLSLRPPMFVGRSCAKYQLNRYLKDVYLNRRTALTVITGRPGVGKTRLLESFAQDCYKQGAATALVVDGSVCASLKFAIYRALFGRLLLKALIEQQVVPALCRFMKTDDEKDARVINLKRLFEAEMAQTAPSEALIESVFEDVFMRLTQNRPLVLCFDNISNEQQNELKQIGLELTVLSRRRLPILMCVVNTTVNDMPTDIELALGKESSLWLRRSITLEPLSNADMHTLVTQSLGISEELAKFIENMTSGLPQIAVLLARQWQLANLLRPTSKGYVSVMPADKLPIPSQVHVAIINQLQLTFVNYPVRAWRPVAVLASLIGDTFTPKILSNAIRHLVVGNKVISHGTFIALALSGGVLKTVDETTLKFANPLLRDALIATIPKSDITGYHSSIATACQELRPTFDNVLLMASHLRLSERYYEAFKAYLNVATQSFQCGDFARAREFIDNARECLNLDSHGVSVRPLDTIRLTILAARIDIETECFEEARLEIRWLEKSCSRISERDVLAELFVLKARLAQFDHNDSNAQIFIHHALEYLQELPEPITPEQLETRFYALVLQYQYDPSCGKDVMDTAHQMKNSVFVSKALLEIARHAMRTKDVMRAGRILNMAIDTAHKAGDSRTEAVALYMTSQLQVDTPDIRIKTLQEALSMYEQNSDFKGLATIHRELAEILRTTRPDEAAIHAHWSEVLNGK
ncbi:MAG: protein kinase [Proteobacteria bacterium]|nr:protein kinase [Pseudomonadota bacterium]